MLSSSEFSAGDQFGLGHKYLVTVVEIRGDEVVLAISSGMGEAAGNLMTSLLAPEMARLEAPYSNARFERQNAS